MKIRTRLFLIVVVMGLVVAAIGGLAVFVTASFTERTEQLEAASQRAFNGEHLNRLVTQVVMDARGIYAAPDVEKAAPFAQGVLKSLDQIDAHLAAWQPLVPAADRPALAKPSAVLVRAVEAVVAAYGAGRIETAEPVLAVNLLLDTPVRFRNAELADLKRRLGDGRLERIEPIHALAGHFTMTCLRGRLRGTITLSPDASPGIQKLVLTGEPIAELVAVAETA